MSIRPVTATKLILTLDIDTMDVDEMVAYVHSIQQTIARRKDQGFPGLLLEHGDGCVWVAEAEIQVDTNPETGVR